MIQVACGGCGKVYRVPDEHAGKRTRCKQCSAVIAIPVILTDPAPVIPTNPAPVIPAEEAAIEPVPAPARRPMKMPPKKVLGGPKKPGGQPRPPFGAKKPLQGRPVGRPLPARKKPADEGAPEGAEGVEAGAGSKKKKVLLLAGLGVVAAAAIGFAAFTFLGGPGKDDGKKVASKPKGGAEAALVDGKEKKEGPGAKAEEKAAVTPEPAAAAVPRSITDPLLIISKDVGFVAKLEAGVLLSLPGAREAMEKGLEGNERLKAILEEAGFDPLSHLRMVWIAGEPDKLMATRQVEPPPGGGAPGEGASPKAAPGGPDVDPSIVILIEGGFDRDKFLGALKKAEWITAKPKSLGKLEIHDMTEGGGHLSLLSAEHLLLGAGKAFNDALKLIDGGSSVRENALLNDLSGEFSSNALAWAAVALSSLPPGLAGRVEAQLQAKVEGAFLEVNRSADGSGAAISLSARCPSAEEVKKLQGTVGEHLKGLPPLVKLFLIGLKTQAEEKSFEISLDLPEKLLQSILATASGAPPPPPEGTEAVAPGAGAEEGDEKAEAEAGEEEKAGPEAGEKPEAAPEEPSAEPKEEAAKEEK